MTEDHFVALGRQLKKLIDRMSETMIQEYDLKPIELDILMLLEESERIETAKDIMLSSHISKAYISKSVEHLSRKNLITLQPDENDHRRIRIILNRNAYEIVEKIKQVRRICRDAMFQGISQEHLDITINTLYQISRNVCLELEKYS